MLHWHVLHSNTLLKVQLVRVGYICKHVDLLVRTMQVHSALRTPATRLSLGLAERQRATLHVAVSHEVVERGGRGEHERPEEQEEPEHCTQRGDAVSSKSAPALSRYLQSREWAGMHKSSCGGKADGLLCGKEAHAGDIGWKCGTQHRRHASTNA